MRFVLKVNGGTGFHFFIGELLSSENPQGWLRSHHFIIDYTQKNEDAGKLHQLFPGVHGEHLAIQLF